MHTEWEVFLSLFQAKGCLPRDFVQLVKYEQRLQAVNKSRKHQVRKLSALKAPC